MIPSKNCIKSIYTVELKSIQIIILIVTIMILLGTTYMNKAKLSVRSMELFHVSKQVRHLALIGTISAVAQ